MPEEGIKLLKHDDILTYDEIVDFVKVCITKGITKVRITGGEPLVRKGVTDLVKMISVLDGISDLSMTTNGTLLDKFAGDLKNAGLNRVNISLDTIDPEKYKYITRGGDITQVFNGIEAAIKTGLLPVKINCVVTDSSQEKDAKEVAGYCKKNNLELRFIHQMNLESGKFSVVEGGIGGKCSMCNRLRLTSNGCVKPCLFSDLGYNIRTMGIEGAIESALKNKPESGSYNHNGNFYSIGG